MGELPRSMQLVVDRTLVGTIAPGTRVTAIGIYSIYQARPETRPPAVHAAVRTSSLRQVLFWSANPTVLTARVIVIGLPAMTRWAAAHTCVSEQRARPAALLLHVPASVPGFATCQACRPPSNKGLWKSVNPPCARCGPMGR